jgi:xylan 1,4-beta-xylosidase
VDAFTEAIPLQFDGAVELRADIVLDTLRFAYRSPGKEWQWLQQTFDASILSDEASPPGLPNFTGAFVGMACQDLSGSGRAADFAWFEYSEREAE